MAAACSLAQLIATALPLVRTTTTGLPVAATASRSCCCVAGRVMSVRSPPKKPGSLDFGFFAFELRGDADDGDGDIRFARGVDSFLLQIGRNPEKADGGFPGSVEIFELDGIGMASLEVDEGGKGAFAVRSPVVDEKFVVEVEAVTAVGAGAQAVIAVDGRDEHAGPADGEIFGGDIGGRRDVVPFEVDGGIDPGGDRRAEEMDVGEKFGGEAGVGNWDRRCAGTGQLVPQLRKADVGDGNGAGFG